jgi:TRAP-type C4-dicarboxylate transport system substrate-binding protein
MSYFKKSIAVLLVLMMIVLTGCSSGSNASQTATAQTTQASSAETTQDAAYEYPELTLSLSTMAAEKTGKSYDCRLFIDKVEAESGGKITFKEYFNASLSKPTANLEAISSGVADCGTVVTLYTPSQLPLAQISYPMPFAPTDPEMISEIMTQISEAHPEFYEEYEKNNVHVLAYKGNEPYKIYTNVKLANLSDLDGKKISMAGIYYIPWFQSQGTAPVSTPAAEVYQAVKTNVSQGMFVYDSLAVEYKYYEVMKYMYDVGMGARNNDTLCINLDVWDSLDEPTQALLEKCAQEAYDEFHQWEIDKMDEWHQALLDAGVEETVMSYEERAEWAQEALAETDTIQMWIDDVTALGYDGSALMQDYFKIAESLGFEWPFDTSKY